MEAAEHPQRRQRRPESAPGIPPQRPPRTAPMYTGSSVCVSFSRSSTMWPYFSLALTL